MRAIRSCTSFCTDDIEYFAVTAKRDFVPEQPRDEDVGTVVEDDRNSASLVPNGWRQALSSTERRQSKASFGRRRSSVGLRRVISTNSRPFLKWISLPILLMRHMDVPRLIGISLNNAVTLLPRPSRVPFTFIE